MRLVVEKKQNLNVDLMSQKYFQNKLNEADTKQKICCLVEELNEKIKSSFSEEEKQKLKSMRQKCYDKKRIAADDSEKANKATDSHTKSIRQSVSSEEPAILNENFGRTHKTFSCPLTLSQSLEVAKNILPIALYSACAAAALGFVWIQSVPLYEASGFTDPKLCAFGALLMIVGFALTHSLTKSKIALLLCLYASAYEVTLIVKGTVKNEVEITTQSIETNSQIKMLKEKTKRAEEAYQETKAKYENPTSKNFQNAWFKSRFVDVSFATYEENQKALEQKMTTLNSTQTDFEKFGMLKILFRLGLVFLCMLSIHNLLKELTRFQFRQTSC